MSTIKLTYGTLRDKEFFMAIAKLNNCAQFKDVRLIANIARIVKLIDKNQNESNDVFLKLLKQYAKLDEKGEVAPAPGKPGTYEIKDDSLIEWQNKYKEFCDVEFEIFAKKLYLHDLVPAQLAPKDLIALEPILHSSDDEKK